MTNTPPVTDGSIHTLETAAAEATRAAMAAAGTDGPVPSAYDGWRILHERFQLLTGHVNAGTGSAPLARREAIEIAAIMLRYATDVCATGDTTDGQ